MHVEGLIHSADTRVVTLTRGVAVEHIAPLVHGNSHGWTETNFLRELNHKWDLSAIAISGGVPIGYMVASVRDPGDAVHIHQAFLSENCRMGFSIFRLLQKVALNTELLGMRALTCKVDKRESAKIDLYLRVGFRLVDREDDGLIWMRAEIKGLRASRWWCRISRAAYLI